MAAHIFIPKHSPEVPEDKAGEIFATIAHFTGHKIAVLCKFRRMILLRIGYWLLCGISILATVLPLVPSRHWSVRIFDYGRVQASVAVSLCLILYPWVTYGRPGMPLIPVLLMMCFIYNMRLLLPYSRLFHRPPVAPNAKQAPIRILTANVYQFHQQPQRFLEVVKQYDADIVFTMESNKTWEKALQPLEASYPYCHKVPQENTYGMHFYTRLEVESLEVKHFVAGDIPSIYARLRDHQGRLFSFYGVHPPPPSPTEEPNSLERDAELLAVARHIRKKGGSTLVAGDFNNVAWSRSSQLFRKTSRLIDPRVGRGLIPTFHTEYRLLRIPIDQLYHSADVFVQKLQRGPDFGSDHYPLYCEFVVCPESDAQVHRVEDIAANEKPEVAARIEEGKAEDSNRPSVATP